MANGIAKVTCLCQLLLELHTPPHHASLVYCDKSAQCTCPPTLSNINAPNTSRLVFTSFGSALQVVTFASCMFLHRLSTPTSSLRDFCLQRSPGCANSCLSCIPSSPCFFGILQQHQRSVHVLNPVQHQRIKHTEINLHFVWERVAGGDIRAMHVPTSSQYVDIFTKGFLSSEVTEFRSSHRRSAGAC